MTVRVSGYLVAATWTASEAEEPAHLPGEPAAQTQDEDAARVDDQVRRQRIQRSVHNTRRLGRLRRELNAIMPPPCDPETARDEILRALARADLGDWTLPQLDDNATRYAADGSVRLDLLAHAILINPWGAFRIVDLHAPGRPYFESNGCDGRAFAPPAELQFG